ncbi:MAG: YcaO-like family protein, partial [Gemmatimonadetes bacterium]|nr:YcaO-like family protein [Gemmatimonadota bacterium]
PGSYLLFDLHRLVLYAEPRGGGEPRIGSVVRWLVDAYPSAPEGLLSRVAREPYRLLYPLEALDLLPSLWAQAPAGWVTTCDLLSGEVRRAPARAHPESVPLRTLGSGAPIPPAPRLRRRITGPSLRAGIPPALEELVAPGAGVVQETSDGTSHPSHPSLPYATALLAWDAGRHVEVCSGKAARPAEASRVALCEAAERFHVAFVPPGEALVHASAAELGERAIDPCALFFGAPDAGDPALLARFAPELPIHWTPALDVRAGAAALVPAQEVWFDLPSRTGEPRLVFPTTNACALGASVEEAGVFALLEAVERDAYLTAWYLRRPCRRIDPDSVRDEGFQLLRRRWSAAYPGYRFYLFDVTTDVAVPSVAAVAVRWSGEGPMTFHAAAARLSAERACAAALRDLAGFWPRLSARRRASLLPYLDDPGRVEGPAGHFGLYSLDETLARLDFLDFGPAPGCDVAEAGERGWFPARPCYDLRRVLDEAAERLHPLGVRLLLKDLTHPWLAARGARCVRAI